MIPPFVRRRPGAQLFAILGGLLFFQQTRSEPPAAAQSPAPPPLTAQQKERLKEREHYAEEAAKFRSQGKLPEAIGAAEK